MIRTVAVFLACGGAAVARAGDGAARAYLHDHEVRAAMAAGQEQQPPLLPDAFDSFGRFEFIETFESAASKAAGADDGAVDAEGGDGDEGEGGEAVPAAKAIPKKLKCSCSFSKIDAADEAGAVQATAFLDAMHRPIRRSKLLRHQ